MNDILRLPLRDQLREHHRHNDHGAMRAVAIKMIDEGMSLEVIQGDTVIRDCENHGVASWAPHRSHAVRIGGAITPTAK